MVPYNITLKLNGWWWLGEGGCHYFFLSRGAIQKNFASLKISSATSSPPPPPPPPAVYVMNAALFKRLGSLATRMSKRPYVYQAKQQVWTFSHAFLYTSLTLLHDYDVKMPNFTFYRRRKQATAKFSVSFWTWVRSQEIYRPGKFAYIRHFQQIGINTTKFENTLIPF